MTPNRLHHVCAGLILLVLSIGVPPVARAVEVRGWTESMPPADMIAGAVAGKLPRGLEVVAVEIRKHTELPNPKVKVWHLETTAEVRATEDLFDVDAGGGPQVTYLVRKTAAGESRPVIAQVVLVIAADGKMSATVKYQPDAKSTFGQPRAVFTSGTVVVRGSAEEAARPAPAPTRAVPVAPAAAMSVIEARLRALVEANGVVHGEDPDVQPALPFTLRDVRFEADGVVKATFTRVSTHAQVPVVGRIRFGQIEFEMDEALREAWRHPSRPPLFLLTPDESALATCTRQVAIPFDPATNRALGERHQRLATPWETAARASSFILAEGDLWDLDAGTKVFESWIPHLGEIRTVRDAPGLFWKTAAEWGVALPVGALTDWGMGTIRPRGQEYAPAFVRDGSGWVAADGVRVVTLENGDFWRAEYDWSTGEMRHRRAVTSIGVFDGAKPLAWHGTQFYVERAGGGAKPVVRIDLASGDMVEMAKPHAFGGAEPYNANRINGSPDGRYLARQHPEGMIFLYDLVREEEFRMEGAHTATLYGQEQRVLDWPRMWASDRVFLGAFGWYDVASRTRRLISSLAPARGFESMNSHVTVVLPGGNFIDTVLVAVPLPPLPKVEERYRIDLRSGDLVRLPDFDEFSVAGNASAAWIDEIRYLFVRTQGGIAEVGVWLHDVRTPSPRRLTALLPDSIARNDARTWSDTMNHRYATSPFLLLPERDQVVFTAARGERRDLLLVSLADGRTDVLESGTAARHLARVIADPIDLNIAGTWTGHWDHASYTERARADAPVSAGDTLTVEEQFLRDLDESDPVRRERLLALFRQFNFGSMHRDRGYWDPVKAAREAEHYFDQQAAARRAELAATRDERARAVLLHDLQRWERGDFEGSEVQRLLLRPEFNRRTFDRERIHALLMREAAAAWTTSSDIAGDRDAFARSYADRMVEDILRDGRAAPSVSAPAALHEWNTRAGALAP